MSALLAKDGTPIEKGKPKDWEAGLREARAKQALKIQKWVMPVLLGIYLFLLAGGVLAAYVVAPRLGSDAQATRIRDLILANTAALQVLAGLVGVMVGYYFRESTE